MDDVEDEYNILKSVDYILMSPYICFSLSVVSLIEIGFIACWCWWVHTSPHFAGDQVDVAKLCDDSELSPAVHLIRIDAVYRSQTIAAVAGHPSDAVQLLIQTLEHPHAKATSYRVDDLDNAYKAVASTGL